MGLSSESENKKVSRKLVCPDFVGGVEGEDPLQALEQKWLEVAGGGTEEHRTQDARTGSLAQRHKWSCGFGHMEITDEARSLASLSRAASTASCLVSCSVLKPRVCSPHSGCGWGGGLLKTHPGHDVPRFLKVSCLPTTVLTVDHHS